MTEHKDHIKDLFKAGLEHYEASPPPHIWEGIVQQKMQRKVVMWKWSAAAAIALLLLSLGTWFMVNQAGHEYDTEKADAAGSESKTIINVEPKEPIETLGFAQEELLAESSQEVVRQTKNKSTTSLDKAAGKQLAQLTSIESGTIEATSPIKQTKQATEEAEKMETTEVKETAASYSLELSKYLAELEELSDIHRDLMKSRKADNKWNLGMAYGTTPNFSMPAEDYTLAPERGTFEVDDFTGDIGQETGYYAQIESTQHRHPLSFGLLTGLPLSNRLEFESGLIYTRLSTISRTYVMNGWQNVYESNLHYVGIPLGMRYAFLQRRHFSLFISQAAIFEKGLRASNTTTNFQDGVLTTSETTFDQVKGFQLSSLSSIGADFAITKQFSIYAQAGVQFFFLNEKQPYNIRSTRTAWPSMQTGLRYRFK